jgi:hypothetical protein
LPQLSEEEFASANKNGRRRPAAGVRQPGAKASNNGSSACDLQPMPNLRRMQRHGSGDALGN